MTQRLLILLTLLALLVACAPAPTPTPLPITETPTMPPAPTTPPEPDALTATRALGRGVNMGNALEAPKEGEWGVVLMKKYFALIKTAGFNSVRIPIRWEAHAASSAPYTIDPVFLKRVDTVLAWALEQDLLVILDFHNYPDLMTNPQAHQERYLAIWKQIAGYYKDQPSTVLFELLNEPNGQLDETRWNTLSGQALEIVRQSNPTRNIVIGGAVWNSYDHLEYLALPENDRHLIATFHYYNPFEFTHQGAEWTEGMDKHLGTTWDATDAEKAAITAQFDKVAAWATAHNRPVLLGEFGAYSKADMASRARWTDFVAREAEKRGFAWSYWEFCAGFGIYDPMANLWREPLLQALMP